MSNNTLFNDDWLKLQRDYWERLGDMARTAMGTATLPSAPAMTNPWQAALDQWWKAMSPAAPPAAQDLMQRFMDQGKTYFRMAEGYLTALGNADAAKSGWDALNKSLEDMQKAFTGGLGGTNFGTANDDSMRRMLSMWEMPFDNWQRMASSLSPMMPGDLLRNMPNADRMLSAPGLGYTREEQAQYQQLMRVTLEYQRSLQAYLGFFNQLGGKAVMRMREFVQGQADAGKTIDSARALYDNWVACCEAVYAEEVSTPDYARVHGELINAQMRLKRTLSVMVDETLGAMNMPTQREMRTLQSRLQETRRENKRLAHHLDQIKRRVDALPPGSAVAKTVAGQGAASGAASAATLAPAATGGPTPPPTPPKRPAPRKKAPARTGD
ncbi:MAG: class III poly(R)-hydroxyalkanoic acid synthase subunit PhaE, partial [Chromatiaceae bacterium]